MFSVFIQSYGVICYTYQYQVKESNYDELW